MRSSRRRLTSTTTSTTTSSSEPDEPVVAVDCNGADLGPAEVAAGAALAAARGARVLLFGPAAELGDPPPGVEVVDAPMSIAKAEDPVAAARANGNASIVLAAKAVADGRAQALVCAGGTGAAVAAGTFNIKRDRGIYRPALALPLPVPGNPVTLLDVGANAEARREHLVQFAFMGAALASVVLGVPRPRVGLLSNGEEDTRGGALLIETGFELRERVGRHRTPADSQGPDGVPVASDIQGGRHGAPADPHSTSHPQPFFDFVGNVEGDNLVTGAADVVVTDGLTGNIALKVLEGASQALLRAIRDAATSSLRAKVGGLLLKPALGGLREEIDPEGVGGAYLLGLRRLGVVPHGRFTRDGFAQAILRARLGAREDIVGRTHAALAEAGALRRSPASAADASLRR